MVWNPKLAVGAALILWVPCLLKKGSFNIIGKQTSGLLCSQLYIRFFSKINFSTLFCKGFPFPFSIFVLLYWTHCNHIRFRNNFLTQMEEPLKTYQSILILWLRDNNYYAKVIMIEWWNKRFEAKNNRFISRGPKGREK